MREPLLIALCLVTCAVVADAQEQKREPIVTSPRSIELSEANEDTNESVADADRKQLIEQKLQQLKALQDEIVRLGGEIPPDPVRSPGAYPQRSAVHRQGVRISLKAVALDLPKLKKLGLNHPLSGAEVEPGQEQVGLVRTQSFRQFRNVDELNSAFELLVAKGCIQTVLMPVVTTAFDQVTNVRCCDHPSDRPGDSQTTDVGEFPIPVRIPGLRTPAASSSPKLGVDVRSRLMPDGRIRLRLSMQLAEDDMTNAIQFEGRLIPGITRRRTSSTIEVDSGEPQVFSVGTTSMPLIETAGSDPAPEPAQEQTQFLILVTADVVSSTDADR